MIDPQSSLPTPRNSDSPSDDTITTEAPALSPEFSKTLQEALEAGNLAQRLCEQRDKPSSKKEVQAAIDAARLKRAQLEIELERSDRIFSERYDELRCTARDSERYTERFFKLSSEYKILLDARNSLTDPEANIDEVEEERKQRARIWYLLSEGCPEDELTGPNPQERWFTDRRWGYERQRNKWYGWGLKRSNVRGWRVARG